jgi:hypothetical protein
MQGYEPITKLNERAHQSDTVFTAVGTKEGEHFGAYLIQELPRFDRSGSK